MDGMCPNSSAYGPSSLVESFHSIPHVDIDLNASPDTFELSIAYFQAIIIWACVPILAVVCLFILLAVYFICVCCCCCCQQHEKRSKASVGICGALVVILVLISLAMVGVAFWAEFELDQNIVQSFNAARNATYTVEDLQNTTVSYNFDEADSETNLRNLNSSLLSQPPGGGRAGAIASTDRLFMINGLLGGLIGEIQAQAMPLSIGDLDAAFVTLDLFELARHWAVFTYLIVTAILLILVALSVCFSACCRSPVCMVIMMIVFFFVTFVMWVAVGANLALLVVSGDICFAPDELIRNYTTDISPQITPELLDYYLICNQTCYSSPFEPLFGNATATFVPLASNESTIQNYVDGLADPVLQLVLSSIVSHFDSAESFVTEMEVLADCEPINTDYLSLLNNLCTDGYLFSVVLFAMACGVAVIMIMILICGAFYAGLLSEGREYDDETVVYDFPNSGDGPTAWDSYGTQQHYTPYKDTYEMRNSPPALGNEPPKYTDLSARHSNGAHFADDGTIGITLRPASEEIDLGDPLNT